MGRSSLEERADSHPGAATRQWSVGAATSAGLPSQRMDLADLQDVIERTYADRDSVRGVPATVAWLAEEIGELAQAVRKGTHEQQVHEFGDVLAWVATLANQQGVDLNEAVERFECGCPKCSAIPCACA
jgi:NTP pyrophosphatase (non-canonical NTP hydrolase)